METRFNSTIATYIGNYPYPNQNTSLYQQGDKYYNVSFGQVRMIKPNLVNKILKTFFK